jgi:hypothetical protein
MKFEGPALSSTSFVNPAVEVPTSSIFIAAVPCSAVPCRPVLLSTVL